MDFWVLFGLVGVKIFFKFEFLGKLFLILKKFLLLLEVGWGFFVFGVGIGFFFGDVLKGFEDNIFLGG